ncbi:MAG: hypothetical protein DRQ51_08285, partial [Gammaproteobacteria bacterium]
GQPPRDCFVPRNDGQPPRDCFVPRNDGQPPRDCFVPRNDRWCRVFAMTVIRWQSLKKNSSITVRYDMNPPSKTKIKSKIKNSHENNDISFQLLSLLLCIWQSRLIGFY